MGQEVSLLTNIQAAVATTVGRCYPLTAPDKPTIPYATYFQVSNVPNVVIDSKIPIENARIQVDVFAKTYAESQSLANSVRTALIAIDGIPLTAMDLYEPEVKLYRVTQDFSFWYQK